VFRSLEHAVVSFLSLTQRCPFFCAASPFSQGCVRCTEQARHFSARYFCFGNACPARGTLRDTYFCGYLYFLPYPIICCFLFHLDSPGSSFRYRALFSSPPSRFPTHRLTYNCGPNPFCEWRSNNKVTFPQPVGPTFPLCWILLTSILTESFYFR